MPMNKIITIIFLSCCFSNVASAQKISKWKVTDFKHYVDTANSELIVIIELVRFLNIEFFPTFFSLCLTSKSSLDATCVTEVTVTTDDG